MRTQPALPTEAIHREKMRPTRGRKGKGKVGPAVPSHPKPALLRSPFCTKRRDEKRCSLRTDRQNSSQRRCTDVLQARLLSSRTAAKAVPAARPATPGGRVESPANGTSRARPTLRYTTRHEKMKRAIYGRTRCPSRCRSLSEATPRPGCRAQSHCACRCTWRASV
jgi:hypothetical protein